MMKQKNLFLLWGGMFILCAALGFIPGPTGFGKWLLVVLSCGFFIPPALLLRQAVDGKDRQTLLLIRNLSLLSLLLTLVLLVGNVLSVRGSEFLGQVLYYILVIVSSPMVCGQYYVLSLFLWACLLMVSLKYTRKK